MVQSKVLKYASLSFFIFNFFLSSSVQAEDIVPFIVNPRNALEAEESARQMESFFYDGVTAFKADPAKAVLLIRYTGPSIPSSLAWAATLFESRHKNRIRFLRDHSNEDGIALVQKLEGQESIIIKSVVDNLETGVDKDNFKSKLHVKFRQVNAELKKFFGLRQGLSFQLLVDPFLNERTGFRQPKTSLLHDFTWQFPVLLSSYFAALYSVMVHVMPFPPDFLNHSHYVMMYSLRTALQAAGQPFPQDPLYFGIATVMVRTFWGFFDRAADGILKLGQKLNPYTNKLDTPYLWQVPAQTMLSFVGDFFISLYGYSFSIYQGGSLEDSAGEAHIAGVIGHVFLNSFTGAFAKNLPKALIFKLCGDDYRGRKLQGRFNGMYGWFHSALKIANLLHAGIIADVAYYGLGAAGLAMVMNRSLQDPGVQNYFHELKSRMKGTSKKALKQDCLYRLRFVSEP